MSIKTFVSMLVIMSLLVGSVLASVSLFDMTDSLMAGSTDDGDWFTMSKDNQRTGFTEEQGPLTDNILWRFEVGGLVREGCVVVDGLVYSVTGNSILWGKVYCLDALTGEEVWCYEVPKAIGSTPYVIDSRIYVESRCTIYCLDAMTGEEIWSDELPDEESITDGGILVEGEYLFVTGEKYVYCLDREDGSIVWRYGDGMIMSGLACQDGVLVAGSFESALSGENASVYCFDIASGCLLWRHIVDYYYGSLSAVCGHPTIRDDRVYFGSSNGHFYCLDLDTGAVIWDYEAGDTDIGDGWAVDHDCVYFSCWDGRVICLMADDGSEVWDYYSGAGYIGPYVPSVAGSCVYFGGGSISTINCIDAATGDFLWKHDLPVGEWCMSPACVVDGRLYIGADDGFIYCFGDPVDISLESIDAGLGSVSMTISNVGNTVIEDITCTIDITGDRFLWGTNHTEESITLEPDEDAIVSCGLFFGFGAFKVTATAGRAYDTAQGSIFLFFTNLD